MKRLAAVAIMTMAAACAAEPPRLEVRDAWTRESAGSTAAVYLTIANEGGSNDRLVAASSPMGTAGIHRSEVTDGIARMRPIPPGAGLNIPSHGTLRLSPGGAHIMLDNPKAPLVRGERFPLTLQFERSPAQRVTVAVRPADASDHAGH